MKIAICLQGLSSGKSDVAARGHRKRIEGNFQSCIDGSLLSIFKNHSVDFFTHTWGNESTSIISQNIKPVKSIYEMPIQFAPKGDYKHSVKSRWYSTCKSIELLEKHIMETGVSYDFVFFSRYDVRYFTDFDLDSLEKDKFYSSHWVTEDPGVDGLLDYWFLCNQEDAIKFGKLYQHIDELLTLDPYPSSHWLSMRWLQKLKIDNRLEFIKYEKKDFNLTRRVEGWTQL